MSVARLSLPVAWRLDGRGGVFSSTLIIDKTRLQQVTSVATSHTHCGVDHLTDNAPALIGGKCGINPSEEKEYHDYERWRHPHMAIAKDTTMKEGWHGKNKKNWCGPGGRAGGPETSANGGDWGPNNRNWPHHRGPHWRCTEPIRRQACVDH